MRVQIHLVVVQYGNYHESQLHCMYRCGYSTACGSSNGGHLQVQIRVLSNN